MANETPLVLILLRFLLRCLQTAAGIFALPWYLYLSLTQVRSHVSRHF